MDLLILLFAVLCNLILGLLVLLRNKKSATNLLFFLLNIDIALWSTANFISLHNNILFPVIFWMRLVMLLAVPQAVLFFLLIHTYPKTKMQLNRLILFVLIIISILTMFVTMTPLLFSSVNYNNGINSPIPGPGIILFLLVAVGSVVAGAITLIVKYRKAVGIEKISLKFILLGLISMFMLILTLNFLLVILVENMSFIAFSPLYTLPFSISVAYVIIKHRFLDMRLIVVRSVAYVFLVFTLGLIYIFGLVSINIINNSTVLGLSTLLANAIPAVIIAFSFQPVLISIETITNKLFFRGRYDPNTLLNSAGKIMSSTFDLHTLSERLLTKVTDEMKISYGFFTLYRTDGSLSIHGVKKIDLPKFEKQDYLGLVNALEGKPDKIIIFEELGESPLKEILRKNNITFCALLTVENQNIGIMCLGEKLSGDIYSSEDINLLKILISEISLAIKNALSIEEIQRFNSTLKQEIDKATKDLKDANIQLQELDHLKDEFVSLASHELRTPMTAIRGSLSTILEGYAGDVSDSAKEFLNAAYNENDRLIRLVNNLLNISRIEAGRLKIEITVINMEEICNEVVGNLSSAAKEKNLELKYEKIDNLSPVKADPDMVREILINIIGNAIKFTHVGGVTVKSMVKDNMVVTSITDTGSGIAEEDQPLLFKKFSQIQGNYAKQAGGTGLGLYICKKIVENMGGNIWLESKIGAGSTFFFSLPIAS